MDLEEIKKRLYTEKPDLGERPEVPRTYEPGFGQEAGQEQEQSQWEKEAEAPQSQPKISRFNSQLLKKVILIMAGLTVVAVAVWFLFFRRAFDSEKVSVIIYGRDRAMAGEEVSYQVRYQNNSRVVLENAKLTFIYPEGSLPKEETGLTEIGNLVASVVSLPDLEPGQQGEREFRANITGLRGDQKTAIARLSYNPVNVSSLYENESEFISEIFLVPLVLDFEMPERVVSGQPLTIGLKYLNTSDVTFSNLILSAEYPPGFVVNSSLPPGEEGKNKWLFSEIGPREEGKIIISGVLSGLEGEVKSFKTKMEQQEGEVSKTVSEGLTSTSISLSPLVIQMLVNNSREHSANPGERLVYKINYRNSTDVQIGPAFIVLKFDTKVLDFSTLKTDGSFKNLDSSITWNESVKKDLGVLLPGQEKQIEFSVQVKEKDNLPIKNFSDKNFLVSVSAKIDSSNVPISLVGTRLEGSDSLATKLNSQLALASKGYWQDSLLPNSGPIPPRVGQQTTYTIYWRITNLANDTGNVVVESFLPPYVSWLNNFSNQDGDVKYDGASGKITWTIGKVAANVGILSPVKQLAFQIALVPNSNQIGSEVTLVKETKITGTDIFSGVALESSAKEVESNLPDDPSITYGGGRVSQ